MFLINNLNKFKNNIAIVSENNKKYTYKKLQENLNNLSKKIKERSLAFIICKNDLSTVIAYLGFLKSKSVIALIDENIKAKSLDNLIELYQPEYIYGINEKHNFEKKEYKKKKFRGKYFMEHNNIPNIRKKFHKDLCLLISTSGTTGSPKLVKLSYLNLESNIKSISKFLNINSKDITITTLPLSYVYGLSILNTHLYNGSQIILNDKSIIQKEFWNKLNTFKVTNFGGVPYLYNIILKLKFLNNFYPYLKYVTIAGGKLDHRDLISLHNLLKKNKTKLIVMYGAAEATARMSYVPYEFFEKKLDSIGIAVPGGKLRIANSKSKFGEIIYKGKNVFMGYAKKLKDLSIIEKNRTELRTGDIGFKDKDGFFYVKGRKDRYIKIYGIRVSLDEIQSILSSNNIENICKIKEKNKIQIFLKENIDIEKVKKIILDNINLHLSVFEFKKVKKFKISNNFKFIL